MCDGGGPPWRERVACVLRLQWGPCAFDCLPHSSVEATPRTRRPTAPSRPPGRQRRLGHKTSPGRQRPLGRQTPGSQRTLGCRRRLGSLMRLRRSTHPFGIERCGSGEGRSAARKPRCGGCGRITRDCPSRPGGRRPAGGARRAGGGGCPAGSSRRSRSRLRCSPWRGWCLRCGMLLAGRLLPLPMVIIFVPLAVALCYFAMRRLPVSWPRFGDSDHDVSPAVAAGLAVGWSRVGPWPRVGCRACCGRSGAGRGAPRRAARDGGDRGRVRGVAGGLAVRAAIRGQRPRRLPAVRLLDRRARDGADSRLGRRVRRRRRAGLREHGLHRVGRVPHCLRSCPGCRSCLPRGPGSAASAARC